MIIMPHVPHPKPYDYYEKVIHTSAKFISADVPVRIYLTFPSCSVINKPDGPPWELTGLFPYEPFKTRWFPEERYGIQVILTITDKKLLEYDNRKTLEEMALNSAKFAYERDRICNDIRSQRGVLPKCRIDGVYVDDMGIQIHEDETKTERYVGKHY